MATLEVHGRRIAYHRFEPQRSSARAPVLCLPSTGLSGLQWRRLAKILSKAGHLVVAVDLLGYGESEDWHGEGHEGAGPFCTQYDVDVVDAILDLPELRGAAVHLVAHSYGGRVGLRAGLRRPELLRSLALFEPTCFGVLRSTGDVEGIGELEAYDADGRFLADEFGGSPEWVERFVDYWSGPGSFAELDDDERDAWLRSRRKMFEEVRETALDTIAHTAYAVAIGVRPTLLLSGSESTRAGQRCCEVFAEILANARHVVIEGVGHMGPVLAAREVATRIAEHIAEAERA